MDTATRSAEFHALLEHARTTATQILGELPENLRYHVDKHTLDFVYPEAMKLAEAEGLGDDGLLVIAVIALFHDTGFVDSYLDNEPHGANRGKEYADQTNTFVLNTLDQIIYDAILNTNMKSEPKNLFEQIIRDADLSVLGKPEFMEWSNRLREELKLHPESAMHAFAMDDKDWAKSQLRFIQSHTWFTQSAADMYQEQKEQNILAFKQAHEAVLAM